MIFGKDTTKINYIVKSSYFLCFNCCFRNKDRFLWNSLKFLTNVNVNLNPVQDGNSGVGVGWVGVMKPPPNPLPKICHTYSTMMKLGIVVPYLKKNKKMYKSRDRPLSSADISIFSAEISKFRHMKKYRYRLHFHAWFLIVLNFWIF